MPKKLTTVVALTAATAVVAVPLTVVLTSGPASAKESNGRCDGARVELSAEKDDGRIEVEADIDDAPRGSRWSVTLTHNGTAFVKGVRTATDDDDDRDRDGEVSIDRDRPDRSGKDAFTFTVNKVGTSGSCTQRVTLR